MASQVESIKWVPGTSFLVDGFAFQSPRCRHYFLTHFHSDHTVGLTRNFDSGVIYCSHVTARLLVHDKGLRRQYIRPLEVGVPVVICDVRVTPLDANHCPGAVMFLFEVPRVAHAADRRQDRGRPVSVSHLEKGLLGPEEQEEGTEGSLAEGSSGGGTQSCDGRPPRKRLPEPRPLPVAQSAAGYMDVAEGRKITPYHEAMQGMKGDGRGGAGSGWLLECSSSPSRGASSGRGVEGDGSEGQGKEEGRDCKGREDGEGMAVGGDCEDEEVGCWAVEQGGNGLWLGGGSEGGCCWQPGGPTHNILHTGDCRWQPWMRHQPGLSGVRVDTLFLDTTYAARKHTLPPQEEAIRMMVQAMRDVLAEEPLTVFLVAAYHIGKERAFLGAAQQLGAKVWVPASKRTLLRLLDLPPHLMELLVEAPRDAAVHVTSWGGMQPEHLQAYLQHHPGVWKRAVGIRPTGWTLRRSGGVTLRRQGDVAVLGVPYSEHSSWTDLCDAVSALRPRRLVPTVNAATAVQRRALVDRFAPFMDLSADRSRLDAYLAPRPTQPGIAGTTRLSGMSTAPSRPLARGSTPAYATTGAHAAANLEGRNGGLCLVSLVDLAAVDVEEQARILADLQHQHRRIQQQQNKQQGRGVEEEGHSSNKSGRGTQRMHGTQGQEEGRSRTSGLKRQGQPAAVWAGGTIAPTMASPGGGAWETSGCGKRQRLCDGELLQPVGASPAAAVASAGATAACWGTDNAGQVGLGRPEDWVGSCPGIQVSGCWQGTITNTTATPANDTTTGALTSAAAFPVIDLTAEVDDEDNAEKGHVTCVRTGDALGPRPQKPVDDPTVMVVVEVTTPPRLAGGVVAEGPGGWLAAAAPSPAVCGAGRVWRGQGRLNGEGGEGGVGAERGRRWGQDGRLAGGARGGMEPQLPLLAQSSIRRFLMPVRRTGVVMG